MRYKGNGIRGHGGKGGGGAGGDVKLVPPPQGTEKFQSNSFLQSLEVVSEGKIFGPIKSDGTKALGVDALESVFLDETRIKEPSQVDNFRENLKFDNVQLVDRLTSSSFNSAIQNSIDNINDFSSSISDQEIISFCDDYAAALVDKKVDLLNFFSKNESELSHLGVIQYNPSGMFTGSLLSGSKTDQYSSNIYNGNSFQSRLIQKPDGDFIKVPESINFIVSNVNTGNYSTHGVDTVYRVSGIFGGLMDFFYIGDEIATGAGGVFLTGKFLFNSGDADIQDKIQSGIENNFDTFVYSDDSISLSTAAQTQKNPAIGETVGNPLALNVVSNKNLKFNFINTYVDFVLGKEDQEKLENFSQVSRSIEISQKILGPFRYGGDARVGDGNDDLRAGGNFSTWQLNMPDESEEFSYTHIIEQREVDDVGVTLLIEQLRDTQDTDQAGIGRDLAESLDVRFEYGFEGDAVIDTLDSEENKVNIIADDVVIFQVSESATQLSSFVSGSGPIYLRKTGNLGTGLATAGTDLVPFGFSESERGDLFINIKSINTLASGSGYSSVAESSPSVVSLAAFQDAEIESGLFLGAGGQIGAAGAFVGGAYRGAFYENSSLVAPDVSIRTNRPLNGATSPLESYLNQGYSPQQIYLNQLREEEDFYFNGIVRSPYLFDASLSQPLPKNSVLKNKTIDDIQYITTDIKNTYNLDGSEVLFPGDTWKNINRYIKIRKMDYETESVLISRDVKVGAVTEKINSNFTYPSSAIFGNVIDARTFSSVPSRSYDLRLKEVLVPSNYVPLRADGSDKRFIDDASTYGLRSVQTFNGSTYVKIPDEINLGTENYEISLKIKLPDMTPSSTVYLFEATGTYPLYLTVNSSGQITFGANSTTSTVAGLSSFSNQILTIFCKRVGAKITLSVTKPDGTILSSESTGTSRSYNLQANGLFLGGETDATNLVENGSKIADFKIKKNNQLLHHWDGTIINTSRLGDCFKDRFGGNHGEIIGTANAVEDSNFEFGPNKEQIYVGEWDGSLKMAWTDNPAWILYDLMNNPIYGIGSRIDDIQDIDIFNLYLIGRYCDGVDEDGLFDGLPDSTDGLEPRFSCNILLSSLENAFQVIGNIASVFRSITYWENGSFNFTADRPKELMATFNNGNVYDGIFNYGDISSTARFSRVEVLYADKNDNFKIKKEYVEDEDAIKKFGLITNEQNGIGITSKSQARRLGKYILNSNKLETESINFRAGQNSLFLSPGDIIRVDDELKNFEINYGKVLDINTGEGYLQIDKIVNTGSITTGDQGGLYLYSNKKQEEIKDLYDIVNFNLSYTGVSEDQDIYSGTLETEKLQNIKNPQISKFYITGFEADVNSNKLFIDRTQSNYQEITGIKTNSFFNVQLENDVAEYYKIIRVSEVEKNIYEVQGIQYAEEKFDLIEERDLDVVQTAYNIGVPANTINTPPAPQGISTGIALNNVGNYDLTGVITGEVGGSETKYRVSLTFPNGDYRFKDFLKDDQLSPPQTAFEFNDLETVGNYTLVATSLRNPESSKSIVGHFQLPYPNKKRNNHIIKSIKMSNGLDLGGSGIQTEANVKFNLELEDFCEKWLSFNSREKPYLKVSLLDENHQEVGVVDGRLRSNEFIFTKFENQSYFSGLNRFYGFEFELYDKNDVLHDAKSYSVLNEIPKINDFQILDGSSALENCIKFNLNFGDSSRDIDRVEVYRSTDPTSGFDLAITQTENLKSFTIPKEFFYNLNSYDTGIYYYKLLPYDDFSSGEFTEVSSGFLLLNEVEAPIEQQKRETIETVWFLQGSGHDVSYSSNGSTNCFLQKSNNEVSYKYLFDLNFETQSTGGGIVEINLSGMNTTGQAKFNLIAGSGSAEVYKTHMLELDQADYYQLSLSGSGCSIGGFSISLDEITAQ